MNRIFQIYQWTNIEISIFSYIDNEKYILVRIDIKINWN